MRLSEALRTHIWSRHEKGGELFPVRIQRHHGRPCGTISSSLFLFIGSAVQSSQKRYLPLNAKLCDIFNRLAIYSNRTAHYHDLCRLHSSSITKWAARIYQERLIKNRQILHDFPTDLVYNHTGYDITSCFQSAAICNWILHKIA